jgi:two-component system, OmpR family, copper resistance phosphate regulon response regulator CusR
VRILVVEDDRKIAKALRKGLEAESHDVAIAHTGEDAFFLVNAHSFELVVLDIMLPGRCGIEILSAMRKRGLKIPVLIVTAKDAIEDRVQGLDAGADDYLVKPFALAELLARVRALLRREPAVTLTIKDLEMDLVTRTVRRAKQPVDLTPREFDLLGYLLQHQGYVVSREMIARDIWKETLRYTPLDNVIDVHMVRLRRKVDEGFATRLLHTVRGVGFMLKADKT